MRANKTASEGGVIVDKVGGDINIGPTFEEHQNALNDALKQKTKDLKRAHKAEKALIRLEMTSIQSRLANIEADYEKTKAELAETKARLLHFENQIDPARKQAAFAELDKGKLTLAKAIFEELAAQSRARALAHKLAKEDADAETAEFEFALGEIAEQEVRWQDAFEHYNEAARIRSCFKYLVRAQVLAQHIANYALSESLVVAAIKAAKLEFGKDSAQLATAFLNCGGLKKEMGHYEAAEKNFEHVLEILQGSLDDDHLLGVVLGNLSELYRESGRIGDAEPMSRRALELVKAEEGVESAHYAIRLSNLGLILCDKYRYKEAELLLRHALKIVHNLDCANQYFLGRILNNLHEPLCALGSDREAEEVLWEALQHTKDALGEDHTDYGIRLNNLASIMVNAGRYKEAEPLIKQSMDNTLENLGREHPFYAIRLSIYAAILGKTGRIEKAREFSHQAMQILNKSFGPHHPKTQKIKYDLTPFLGNRSPAD